MRMLSLRSYFSLEQKLHLRAMFLLFFTQKSERVTVDPSKTKDLAPKSLVLYRCLDGRMMTLAIQSMLGPSRFILLTYNYNFIIQITAHIQSTIYFQSVSPFNELNKTQQKLNQILPYEMATFIILIMKTPKIISLVGLPKRICEPLTFPLSPQVQQQIAMLKLAFRDSFAEHKVYSLGLSAPQINVWKRFLIMPKNFLYGQITDFRQLKQKVRHFNTYINPTILNFSQEKVEMNEYCLSIGLNQYKVIRPKIVEVQYYKQDGLMVKETLDPLRSRIMQHEMDHLNGIIMSEIPGVKMVPNKKLKRSKKVQEEVQKS